MRPMKVMDENDEWRRNPCDCQTCETCDLYSTARQRAVCVREHQLMGIAAAICICRLEISMLIQPASHLVFGLRSLC